jgi:hypothetical protein
VYPETAQSLDELKRAAEEFTWNVPEYFNFATDVVDRWSDNVRSAVEEGRTAMRERETELDSSFDRVAGH